MSNFIYKAPNVSSGETYKKWKIQHSFFLIVVLTIVFYGLGSNAAVVDSSRASAGYTFFYRVKATLEQHNRDLSDCLAIALPLTPPGQSAQGVLPNLIKNMQTSFFMRANVEKCMLARRWVVVRLPDQEGRQLEQLVDDKLREQIAGYLQNLSPPGDVVRYFGQPEQIVSSWAFTQDHSHSLSIRVIDVSKIQFDNNLKQETAGFSSMRAEAKARIRPSNQTDNILIGTNAILVVSVRGISPKNLPGLTFFRMAASAANYNHEKPPAGEQWLTATPQATNAGSANQSAISTYIYSVNPGLWTGGTTPSCLLAPYFEVKPGDVLYLGLFDLDNPSVVDFELSPARNALAGNPDALRNLQPASWINGLTWTCRTLMVGSGYEIQGAPYPADWRWKPDFDQSVKGD